MRKKIKNSIKRVLKGLDAGCKCIIIVLKSLFLAFLTFSRGKRADLTKQLDQEVIILGNGPSLNDVDLEKVKLAGVKVACVNYFPSRNKDFWKIKPDYLCLIDPAFFDWDPKQIPAIKDLFAVLEKVDWQLTLICPQKRRIPVQNENIVYEHVNCSTLHSTHMSRYLQFMYQHNILIPGMRNVAIGAGYYFASRKVKHLYYAGIDMSEFKCLFVDESNDIYTDATHSYGTERHYTTVVGKGEFCYLLDMYQQMFEEFYFLKRYADQQGVSVTNLSTNSYVDVFVKEALFYKE